MEKFNLEKHWNDFLNNNIMINCKTRELAKIFLNYCHIQGLKWYSGKSLLDKDNWSEYKKGTHYIYDRDAYGDNDGLLYGMSQPEDNLIEFMGFNQDVILSKEESKILSDNMYQEYKKDKIPTTITKETIEVIYHNKETIVLIKADGRYYKGVASCHYQDIYDKEQGFMVAYQRARENQKKLNTTKLKQESLPDEVISLCDTCIHNSANSGIPCYDRWLEMGGKENKYICWEK